MSNHSASGNRVPSEIAPFNITFFIMCKSLLSSEYSDSVRPLYPQPGQPYVHRSFQIWHRIRQWSGYVLTANHGIAHTCVCFSTEYCLNRPPQDCRRGEGSQMPFNMLTFFAERRIHHNSVIDRCCFSRQQIVSDHIVLFSFRISQSLSYAQCSPHGPLLPLRRRQCCRSRPPAPAHGCLYGHRPAPQALLPAPGA